MTPAREGMAIIAAIKAGLGALRGYPRHAPQPRPPRRGRRPAVHRLIVRRPPIGGAAARHRRLYSTPACMVEVGLRSLRVLHARIAGCAGRRPAASSRSPCGAGVTATRNPKSSAAAKELGDVLDRRKLDSIAAADPADAGHWVAALYFPGSQMLVVSANIPRPSLFTDKLRRKDFRDIYIDLKPRLDRRDQGIRQDQTADGLREARERQCRRQLGTGRTRPRFDGEWKKAKMTRSRSVPRRRYGRCCDAAIRVGCHRRLGVSLRERPKPKTRDP